MEQHQQKALLESIVSSIIKLAIANGADISALDQSVRESIREDILSMAADIKPDPENWVYVKSKMLYDVYLQMRTEAGTLTRADETRAGLVSAQFSDPAEYHKHCVRVAEARKEADAGAVKTCSACGLTKPVSKFKRKGGAVCSACQGKQYRERKQNEA